MAWPAAGRLVQGRAARCAPGLRAGGRLAGSRAALWLVISVSAMSLLRGASAPLSQASSLACRGR